MEITCFPGLYKDDNYSSKDIFFIYLTRYCFVQWGEESKGILILTSCVCQSRLIYAVITNKFQLLSNLKQQKVLAFATVSLQNNDKDSSQHSPWGCWRLFEHLFLHHKVTGKVNCLLDVKGFESDMQLLLRFLWPKTVTWQFLTEKSAMFSPTRHLKRTRMFVSTSNYCFCSSCNLQCHMGN